MSEYGKMQFQMFLARAQFFHAEAVTGAYKLRTTQRGVEGGGWRGLTDDEKLHDCLATMQRHLQRAQEILDSDPIP